MAYRRVSAEGLSQCGHSKDYRPDLPHVKVMQAILGALGMPRATNEVSGGGAALRLTGADLPNLLLDDESRSARWEVAAYLYVSPFFL